MVTYKGKPGVGSLGSYASVTLATGLPAPAGRNGCSVTPQCGGTVMSAEVDSSGRLVASVKSANAWNPDSGANWLFLTLFYLAAS